MDNLEGLSLRHHLNSGLTLTPQETSKHPSTQNLWYMLSSKL
jgi:hypothetical protein